MPEPSGMFGPHASLLLPFHPPQLPTGISAPYPIKHFYSLSLGLCCVCYTSRVFLFSVIQEAICSIIRASPPPHPQKKDKVENLLSKHLLSLSARGCNKSCWPGLWACGSRGQNAFPAASNIGCGLMRLFGIGHAKGTVASVSSLASAA